MRHALLVGLFCALVVAAAGAASATPICEMSDAELLDLMHAWNDQAEEAGLGIAIEEIACFTFGNGRPPVRIHQQPFRWVPGDPRRAASGDDITFMLDDTNNAGPSSPLVAGYPTASLRAAMNTWDGDKCLRKVDLVERPSLPGVDSTIFDADFLPGPFFGFCPAGDVGAPGDGFPFNADIVDAGWYPASCFGFGTLAFSVTFIFTSPFDLNGDNYLDTALNEVYWNDAWGNPGLPAGDPRIGFPWDDSNPGSPLPSIDVQTVGFHEYGHSLGIGHFGPPPAAVMNPIYAGPRRSAFPIDKAGMCTVWSSWPNP